MNAPVPIERSHDPAVLRETAERIYREWVTNPAMWPPARVESLHPEVRAAVRWLATTGGVW